MPHPGRTVLTRILRGRSLAAAAGILCTAGLVVAAVALRPAAHPATSSGTPPASASAASHPRVVPVTAVRGKPRACISVPILVYHYIKLDTTDRPHSLGWNLSVAPVEFQAQMDWMRAAGGHTVTLSQVMLAMEGGPPLPAHPVVLTFDDGYDDFATAAAPIMAADGFIGEDFVVSGFIGRHAYMTAQQVQSVAAMGMVIGAHTVHHVDLVALSPQLAQIEIEASKATLQQLLGRPVLDFAYPYGDVNATVAALVARAGFRDAVTTRYGHTECLANPYLMPRLRVGGADTVWSFARDAGIAVPPATWVDRRPAAPGISSGAA